MDRYEQELEERITNLVDALAAPSTYKYLSVDEIVSIEGDLYTLEERLYQYRLKKESDGRIYIHSEQEQSVPAGGGNQPVHPAHGAQINQRSQALDQRRGEKVQGRSEATRDLGENSGAKGGEGDAE